MPYRPWNFSNGELRQSLLFRGHIAVTLASLMGPCLDTKLDHAALVSDRVTKQRHQAMRIASHREGCLTTDYNAAATTPPWLEGFLDNDGCLIRHLQKVGRTNLHAQVTQTQHLQRTHA